ncbi:DUF2207 domain-containing protein [Calidifontibacter terrae]
MTDIDLGSLVIGGVLIVVAGTIVGWLRWRRRDKEYVGLTPGLLPADRNHARTRRVRGGLEWKGTVAVSFAPPQGIGPAVAGTIIDGRVDNRDLAGMLVDLALRGYYKIEKIDDDWEFHQSPTLPPNDQLTGAEQRMARAIFAQGPVVRLSLLKERFGMTLREVQIDLYREMLQRGWYTKHPRTRSRLPTLFGVLLLFGTAFMGAVAHELYLQDDAPYAYALPAATGVAAILFLVFGRGRSARTADGTAARIQTMGFEKYLATAEADQIRFEEAAGLFSRYLPYAIVFGLADRWAKVMGSVMRRAQAEGWLDVSTEGLGDWLLLDGIWNTSGLALDGISGLLDFAGSGDALGLIGEGLSDVSGFWSDFASSAGDLFSEAGGCLDGCDLDGCDGCDAGCIDF